MVPGFLKFVTRPMYGVILRLVGVCLIVVGLVAAGLDASWAGFSPVVWLLLALLAFLGVVCNELAQMIVRKGAGHHAETVDLRNAPEKPEALAKAPESAKPAEASGIEVDIYCVKCRDHRMIKDPVKVTLPNGRPAYQGSCPVCGTKVNRFLKVG